MKFGGFIFQLDIENVLMYGSVTFKNHSSPNCTALATSGYKATYVDRNTEDMFNSVLQI